MAVDKRRKIALGDDLDRAVKRLAEQYKVSEVDVIRMAVAAYATKGDL